RARSSADNAKSAIRHPTDNSDTFWHIRIKCQYCQSIEPCQGELSRRATFPWPATLARPGRPILETSMRRVSLDLAVDREFVQRLLATGRAFDLETGGLSDARSGVINVWCSPDDKPACWHRPRRRDR